MAAATTKQVGDITIAVWEDETGTGGAAFLGVPAVATVQRLGGTGTVTVEGSLDGINWGALTSDGTTAISLATATKIPTNIYEKTLSVRVVVASGTATVVIVAK